MMAIISFLHPGLERFAKTGDVTGIQVNHASRLIKLLAMLSFSGGVPGAFRQIPGFHSVKRMYSRCRDSDVYAVRISRSWRLTFRLTEDGDICDLNYVQYH